MYGDPDRLLTLAGSIEARADEVRQTARAMVHRGDTTQWQGLAAEKHREALRTDAAAFVSCADKLDDAAAALRAHAEKVREMIARIAAAEHQVTAWFHDAESWVSKGIHGLEHAASGLWHDVTGQPAHSAPWAHWPWTPSSPPASGSKDWLELADLVKHAGALS